MIKVLLVDDNKNIREFCQSELELEGYSVFSARNGKEALSVLNDIIPDIVVLDIRMPEMDGFETLRRILIQRDDIPIIFHTTYKDGIDLDFWSGLADGFVEKSENLDELKLKIEQVLKQRKKLLAYHKSNLLKNTFNSMNYAPKQDQHLRSRKTD